MRIGLKSCAAGALFIFMTLSTGAWAAVPSSIGFQGMLKDGLGDPVSDSTYSVIFRIYDAPVAGSSLWFESQMVSTSAGLFNAVLGAVTAIPDSVFNDTTRFLGITVFPDAEMNPREQLRTVPYAFRVASVHGATGGAISGDVDVTGELIRTIARTHGYLNDGTNSGPVSGRSLVYNKQDASTAIRVTYTDNMAVITPSTGGQWEIRFNGASCTNPGPLVYHFYSGDVAAMDLFRSQTVCGTCFGLPAGSTTIEVYVGPAPGYGLVDLNTGWSSSYFSIEAEEVR